METDPRHSRILDLPAELRNRIYDYVFADLQDKTIHVTTGSDDNIDLRFKRRIRARSNKINDFALRGTCHQIREETKNGYWYGKLDVTGVVNNSQDVENGLKNTAHEVKFFNIHMAHRWTTIQHIMFNPPVVNTGLVYTFYPPEFGEGQLARALECLKWPTPSRNVSKLTMYAIPGTKRPPHAATKIRYLSLVKSFFYTLKEINLVWDGKNAQSHRYFLKDNEIWSWYTKEFVCRLKMKDI